MKDSCLITGGAGFVGVNLADHYLSNGKKVIIFDNFSRRGTEDNVAWLKEQYGEDVEVVRGDVRDNNDTLLRLADKVEAVFHLAAQVAVTTSVTNPREDFEINALGTFNVLEAVRQSSARPVVVYASTNKVYGKMADIAVTQGASESRYIYQDLPEGAPESRPLDFYSPYGCSKGTGDQYMIDYARIYDLNTVVMRQSCIYGPHQFGIEDQGWVAWFAIRAMLNSPVTIFGDGKQVRDVLHVHDLIAAYNSAIDNIDITSGKAYNVGGGPQSTLSLLELIDLLEGHFDKRLEYSFDEWRPGDQLVFISDIRKAKEEFGWEPKMDAAQGVAQLSGWLKENKHLFLEMVK